MVATVILGACAGSIISVSSSNSQKTSLAGERMAALAAAESEIASIRASARTNVLAVGTTNRSIALASAARNVRVIKIISKVAGYSDLFQAKVEVQWDDSSRVGQTRTLKVITLVRAPYE